MNKSIWTPGYSFMDIKDIVDEYRRQYPMLQTIPVDIEAFLEFDLKINIEPSADLKNRVQAEAMISLDFSTIYVDKEAFCNEKLWNRLRFSLAHELGHLVLHKDFFDRQIIRSESDWLQFMSDIQLKYVFLEYQANCFAGQILMPTDELRKELQNDSVPTIATLSRKFEVSTASVKKRIVCEDTIDILKSIE